jgi:tetratricopeptide (TPR) repeat protein
MERERYDWIPYPLQVDLLQVEMTPEEAFLLSQVDGLRTAREIAGLLPFPEETTYTLLDRLTEKRVIAWREAPASPKRSSVRPKPSSPPEDPEVEGLKKRVELYRKLLEKGDPFFLFGIKPGTPDDEVREKFRELSSRFHPDRYYHLTLPPQLKSDLEEIYTAIRDQYQLVATEEARRRTYLKLRGLEPEKPPSGKAPLDLLRLESLLQEALRMGQYDNALKLIDLIRGLNASYPAEEKRKKIEALRRLEGVLEEFLRGELVRDLDRIEKMHTALIRAQEDLPLVPRLLASATMFLYLYTEDVPRMIRWVEELLERESKPEYHLLAAKIYLKGEDVDRALVSLKKIPSTSPCAREAKELLKEIQRR